MRNNVAAAACILFVMTAGVSQAQDFLVSSFKFNPVTQPTSILDHYDDCRNNPLCRTMMDVVVTAAGGGAGTLEFVDAIAPQFSFVGEETWVVVPANSGYKVCRASRYLRSISPRSGKRSAHFSLQALPDRVQIYSWVPQAGGIARGRNWIEADISVLMVREGLYYRSRVNGTCDTVPGEIVHFTCRGDQSGAHGWPPCPSNAAATLVCPAGVCRRLP